MDNNFFCASSPLLTRERTPKRVITTMKVPFDVYFPSNQLIILIINALGLDRMHHVSAKTSTFTPPTHLFFICVGITSYPLYSFCSAHPCMY